MTTKKITKKYDYSLFNNVPGIEFKEITEKEFAQSNFFIWQYSKPDLRQITNNEKGKLEKEIHLICFTREDEPTSGFGMTAHYYDKKIRYFQWGCEHDMMEIEPEMRGRCIHTYKCKKCGRIETHDSSD